MSEVSHLQVHVSTWYESPEGDVAFEPAEGYPYRTSIYINAARQDMIGVETGAPMTSAMKYWDPEVVTQLVRDGLSVNHAITAAIMMCTRCLAATRDRLGLSGGYSKTSDAFRNHPSRCGECAEEGDIIP